MKSEYDQKVESFALCALSVRAHLETDQSAIEHAWKMGSDHMSHEMMEEGEKLAKKWLTDGIGR